MSLRLLPGVGALTGLAKAAFSANPDVGGAPSFETRNIVENAVNSADHTRLVAAVKAAVLVDALLLPENKVMLTKVLTAHVVAGDLKLADQRAAVGADGFANLNTLSGDALSVRFKGDTAMIHSDSKNIGTVSVGDVDQSNGVIHVIEAVGIPN